MVKIIFELPDELNAKMRKVIDERGMTIKSFIIKTIENELVNKLKSEVKE